MCTIGRLNTSIHDFGPMKQRQFILLQLTGGNENNWWGPPVGLISRLIQHARKTKARGTLIAPYWPSATFWPVMFPEGSLPADFVQEVIQLPSCDWFLVPGFTGRTLFNGPPSTDLLALQISFEDITLGGW